MMDCSYSISDDLDEVLTPQRSPSRLDFCTRDLGESHDPETYRMEWAPFGDDCLYALIEEDTFAVELAAPDYLRILVGDDEDTDTLPTLPATEECSMNRVVIEPQAPTPVRPPAVQFQTDAEEQPLLSRTASQRLNYVHHGFSRSALLQQKNFWNSRHEEWAEWQSRMEQSGAQQQKIDTDDAYTGLASSRPRVLESSPPHMRTPPSGLERDLADHPPRKPEQDVHASIYPRVGDIAALRDPYSVNIDRCFFRYPLWTLHKTLYVFNMHQQAVSVNDTAGVSAFRSSSSLSSYTSSSIGDDRESDSTLVAEDKAPPKNRAPPEPSNSPSPLYSPPTWTRFCGWELSWYARWELLLGLFQCDQAKGDNPGIPMTLPTPPSKATPLPPPQRTFRFTVGYDGNDVEDDEEEDYGTLLSDSSFAMDFNDGCERAMAFYHREPTCSEVVVL